MVRRGAAGGLAAFAGMAGRALLKRGAKQVAKYYSKSKKQRASSGGRASLGITNQYDVARLYRGKRRSRRSKAFGRFSSKVRKVIDKQLPPQIELMRSHGDFTAAINTQGYVGVWLYGEAGGGGTQDMGVLDLSHLVDNAVNSNVLTTNTSKLDIKSAYLDLYITNTGLVPSTTTCYVDIYTVYCRRDTYTGNGGANWMNSVWADSGNLSAGVLGTPSTALTTATMGTTLFMNPMFCSYFKIGEVRRVVLEPGQTYNTQLKDHKNRTYKYQASQKTVCKAGWTKGFILLFRGAAAYNAQDAPSQITVEALRTYNYVIKETAPQSAGRIDG